MFERIIKVLSTFDLSNDELDIILDSVDNFDRDPQIHSSRIELILSLYS